MARAVPPGLRRHRRRHHPRPLLPRQRRPLDPRARPRQGHARSKATTRVGSSRSSSASPRRRSRTRRGSARSSTSSNGCGWRPRPARPRARRGSPPTSSSSPRRRRPRDTSAAARDRRSRPGPRLGDQVIEAQDLAKGVRRPPADRGPDVLAPPRRHRRRHRPQRRRQDHAVPDDRGIGARRWRRPRYRPTPASLVVGSTVELAYVDQSRDSLDGDQHGVRGDHRRPRRPQGRQPRDQRPGLRAPAFNFKGSDQQKKVGDLSGRRAQPGAPRQGARRGGNVLLLDEPTNDLDVDTLRALEDGLDAFPGCAVVISHDRWFLDRIATHILAFEGDSQVRWFEGNFTEYEASAARSWRRRRPAPPHQVQAADRRNGPCSPRSIAPPCVILGSSCGRHRRHDRRSSHRPTTTAIAITFGPSVSRGRRHLPDRWSRRVTAPTTEITFDERQRPRAIEGRIEALVEAGADEADRPRPGSRGGPARSQRTRACVDNDA